ncbi:MAG: PilZ domain-containing protein [Treponema sp.]|nr:PilZ domain-containing protein [Treponema sp.]
MSENSEILGKKVFFLYPSAVVQNRITEELIQQEFEVYTVKDHARLRKLLAKYPDSIVFANIFDGMTEKEWEAWIRGVLSDTSTSNVKIGIMSAGDDEALKRKYINEVKIPCGYIAIKTDLNVAMKQLFDTLRTVDAKGRRKYIRAVIDSEANTTVNFPNHGTFVHGSIKDISVVGFSCHFDEDPNFPKNSLHQDIQIKLQTNILKAEGIVFGSRMDGNTKIYVVLFTQRIDPDTRARIRRYIQSNLQTKLESEL